MTAYDGVFVEQSATPVVRKVALAHHGSPPPDAPAQTSWGSARPG